MNIISLPSLSGVNPKIAATLTQMGMQLNQLYEYNEFTFPKSAAQKQRRLDELTGLIVEHGKERIQEDKLPDSIRALFWLIIGTSFNVYDVYDSYASVCIQRALRFDPNLPDANLQYGISSIKAGAWRRAESFLSTARRLMELRPEPLIYLSLMYRLRPADLFVDSLDAAVSCARQAIQVNPNNEQSWFCLGMSLLRRSLSSHTSDLIRASQALKRSIGIRELRRQPYPDARFNLAMLSRLLLDLQTAYQQFRTAFDEDPSLVQAQAGYKEIEGVVSAIHGRLSERCAAWQPSENVAAVAKRLSDLGYGKNLCRIRVRVVSEIGQTNMPPCFFIVSDEETDAPAELGASKRKERASLVLHQVSSEVGPGTILAIDKPLCSILRLHTPRQDFVLPLLTLSADITQCCRVVEGASEHAVTQESITGAVVVSGLLHDSVQ